MVRVTEVARGRLRNRSQEVLQERGTGPGHAPHIGDNRPAGWHLGIRPRVFVDLGEQVKAPWFVVARREEGLEFSHTEETSVPEMLEESSKS